MKSSAAKLRYMRRYYRENRDKVLATSRLCYRKFIEKRKAWGRRYYKKNRAQRLRASQAWYQSHKAQHRFVANRWKQKNPDKVLTSRLRKYGITASDFYALWQSQEGRCDICGKKLQKGKKQGVHVDHCHKSQKVRGLLCGKCNIMVGAARDSINILKAAIRYIRRFSCPKSA